MVLERTRFMTAVMTGQDNYGYTGSRYVDTGVGELDNIFMRKKFSEVHVAISQFRGKINCLETYSSFSNIKFDTF